MLSFVIKSAIILSVAIIIVILVLLCGVSHFIVMLSFIMPDIVMLSVAFFIPMLNIAVSPSGINPITEI